MKGQNHCSIAHSYNHLTSNLNNFHNANKPNKPNTPSNPSNCARRTAVVLPPEVDLVNGDEMGSMGSMGSIPPRQGRPGGLIPPAATG